MNDHSFRNSLSKIGQQMSKLTGVRVIVKELSESSKLTGSNKYIDLSAGNPVVLPELESLWKDCTQDLLSSPDYSDVVCRYGSSKGYDKFVDVIVQDLNRRYSTNLTSANVLISPGSQVLYFYAANSFGGYAADGSLRKVLIPFSPEYTGFGNISLIPELLVSFKPNIELDDKTHRFKYCPDFNKFEISESTGCIIFSRPCNPTGNILDVNEVDKIVSPAADLGIPVFIDSAYGEPFPALNYKEMKPIFSKKNVVNCFSLSKAGLPGERVGIAVGDKNIIEMLESFQSNLCVHSSRYGQAIAQRAIQTGLLSNIAINVVRPYYRNKLLFLAEKLNEYMPDNLPWYMHICEGSIYAWLWFKQMPVSDTELYIRLKREGVLVVPGYLFFPGLRDDWNHKRECIRLSVTANDQDIDVGVKRIANVLNEIYKSQ